jgi:hypothetical protein
VCRGEFSALCQTLPPILLNRDLPAGVKSH